MTKKRKRRDHSNDHGDIVMPTAVTVPVIPAPTTAPPLSRRRIWLFRLLAATLIPGLLLLVLEATLRLAGYGHPTAYFVQTTIKEHDTWVGNQQFALRFFPPALARELDRPMVSASKPPGAIRIFVLGDSAAQGDPAPAFAFSRILDVMLRARFPAMHFEVINTAVTAINSHVILPIAADCARLEPDFFIIYMGNNEVIGPYGPATVFTPAAQNLTVMRATIALKTTRIGQAIASCIRGSATAKMPDEWGGLSMFLGNRIRHDDPRMESVHDHLARNLRDIIGVGRGAGSRVIVCTLGVNLKDCAPFSSLSRSDMAGAELSRWTSLMDEGMAAEAKGMAEQAIAAYSSALTIDDSFADLHFRLGRCHATLGHDAQALSAFSLARDLDALPFRATSRMIGIMRDAGTNRETEQIYLADVARAYEQDSAHGLPDSSLFHEHVHMTFHGNYVAARTVLEQVERTLGSPAPDQLPSERACADALCHTEWEQLRIANEVLGRINGAPFSTQLDNADNKRRLEADIVRLRTSELPAELAAGDDAYRTALMHRPDDWRLHELRGRFLIEGRHDATNAVASFRQVLSAIPFDYHAQYNLAVALRDAKQLDEAAACFQEALRLKPDHADALSGLAILRTTQHRGDEAQALFARALALQPWNAEAHGALGRQAEAEGRFDEALDHFTKARYTTVQLATAHNRIAITLAKAGTVDPAERHFREALVLYPEYADAHFNLGNLLSRKGDKDAALTSFGDAIRLKPELAEAHAQIGQILLAKRQTDRAIESLTKALKLKPDLATTQNSLGAALASQGRLSEAIVHFSEAVRLRPAGLEVKWRIVFNPRKPILTATREAIDGDVRRLLQQCANS